MSLNPESRAIIDAARPGEDLPTEARDRMRRKLMIATGVAAGATTVTKAAAAVHLTQAAIPMVSGVGMLTKLGAALLLVGGIGVGARQLMLEDARPATTASVSVSPTSPAPAPPAALSERAEPVEREAAPAPPASADTAPPAVAPSVRAARPAASSIAAETELLQRAQTELAAGDADKALELLDQHQSEHATGALREERQAARVIALCRAGRGDEARVEARRFAAEFPRSPHRARVTSACAGE